VHGLVIRWPGISGSGHLRIPGWNAPKGAPVVSKRCLVVPPTPLP